MGKYDYSGYDDKNMGGSEDPGFWGLHRVGGRIEVDVKRYVDRCGDLNARENIPKQFEDGGIEYYVPSKLERYDYTVNYLMDSLDGLRDDWREEYKPAFSKIRTPKDVEEGYRLSAIAFTGDSDDYENIDTDARLAAVKRISKYDSVLNELYCMFLSKVCIETDRFLLNAISSLGYEGRDFDMKSFVTFCNGRNGAVSFSDIEGSGQFSKLHDVNNFIKHNSEKSYGALRRFHPECVWYDEEGKHPYENGMYAGDWLKFEEADIEDFLRDLRVFFRDFCRKILGEDPDRAWWDYDGFFVAAFNDMKDPCAYLGLY